MQETIPDQVQSLLYNEMKQEMFGNMTDDDLKFFAGILHSWYEETLKRIEARRVLTGQEERRQGTL